MTDRTPALVLQAAADDVAENWCRTTNESIAEDGQRKHCMLGAINVAAGVPVDLYTSEDIEAYAREFNGVDGLFIPLWFIRLDHEAVALRDEALRVLFPVVRQRQGLPTELVVDPEARNPDYRREQTYLVTAAYGFNDASTQEEVESALREAAERVAEISV